MRKTLILISAVIMTAPAFADTHYLCYMTTYNSLIFAKIPGPGTYAGLDVVDTVSGPYLSDALTYDGEYWWLEKNNVIYCFDQGGDYVSEFPAPSDGTVGLGWDGNYLWIADASWPWTAYQRDTAGNPGPYGPFDIGYGQPGGLTVAGDEVIIGLGNWGMAHMIAYDFNGNETGFHTRHEGITDASFYSLGYHDNVIWAAHAQSDYENTYYTLFGYEYDPGLKDWDIVTTVNNQEKMTSLTVCEADFIGIASSSLGKIKAYFNEE